MRAEKYDVIVIGAGPAGLAAAISAHDNKASVVIVEREARVGGILKQCIHDGFGLIRFSKKLAGCEYAQIFIDEAEKKNIKIKTQTFCTNIVFENDTYILTLTSKDGVEYLSSKALVLACGCRERTAKQVMIHGTRPSGVFTAGSAQYYTNILGKLPTKKCVILGSGDIGLIMARRLTLEGAQVLGVYEAKKTPSGLMRNIAQCLNDFNIPLYTSKTVTRVFGTDRLCAVEISDVDENMQPVEATQEIIECDALILSVGLIPENELASSLGLTIDNRTKGPVTDQNFMSDKQGVFICGNELHVNDLVDYVSESGELAGKAAALFNPCERQYANIRTEGNLAYTVPQRLQTDNLNGSVPVFFRVTKDMKDMLLKIKLNGEVILKKKYSVLRPPEMQRIEVAFNEYEINENSDIVFSLEDNE